MRGRKSLASARLVETGRVMLCEGVKDKCLIRKGFCLLFFNIS